MRFNPVVTKELRSRMRGSRAFIVLTIYLLLLGIGVFIIFLGLITSQASGAGPLVRPVMGKAIFGMAVGLELLTVSFIAPALTAGAISSEREGHTYDLVRTTLLPARSLVFGKLFSALAFILLLLFAALPLQSLAFLFGGVAMVEVLIATLLLLVTTLSFCAMGLFFSSLTRRTLVATALSYASAILLVFGLPMLLGVGFVMFNSLAYNIQSPPGVTTILVLLLAGWFLVSVNPVATAVVSEVLLLQEQALYYYPFPLQDGSSLTILSPWISFTLFYSLLSLLLIWLSIRAVRQPEK